MKDYQQTRPTRTHYYSLIELLTVMAIMAILMGFGVAAYLGVKGHKGSEAGAQRMADMIALARQYAISENTRVALLLPDEDSGFYNDVENEDALPNPLAQNDSPGIMMHFCIVNASSGGFVFVEWLDVGGWVHMPQNSYFAAKKLSSVSGIKYDDDSNSRNVDALIFNSNGTLPTRIDLGDEDEGIFVRPYSTSQSYYDPGKARQYRITVNWLTGMTTTWMKVGDEWR